MEETNTQEEEILSMTGLVKEWVAIDNEISSYQKKIRVFNVDKKRISKQLLECMKQQQIDQINLNNNESILYKKSVSKKAVNKQSLNNLLQQYLHNTDVNVEDMIKFIYDNRESVEKENVVKKQGKTDI
jgi:hypothetical protein